jgi:putative ABC transport system permease protein
MTNVPHWRRYLRFWRSDIDADIDDELRFHFETRAEELRARGFSREEAVRTVAEEFGDVEATRRRLHDIGERLERRRERAHWWNLTGADFRYALRGLRAAPLFTAGVVLTIALGIGAATSMYGTMRRLLLQPPPHVSDPQALARPYLHYQLTADSTRTTDRLSYPFYEWLRENARSLSGVAAYNPTEELVVGTGPDARIARATLVSAGFWRTLGTRPLIGRLIADEEAHPATGARVIVLSYAFWQRRFAGSPSVLGRTLNVKGQPYEIVGVAPRGFRGVELTDTDVWLPFFAAADGESRAPTWHTFASSSNLKFVVRPRTGTPSAQVSAEITRAQSAVLEEALQRFPPDVRDQMRGRGSSVMLQPITGALGPDGHRMPEATVAIWLAGVAFVLLVIACANVASLFLLRALRRRREIAVRLALGMNHRRLAGMLFVESAVVALAGGAAALAINAVGGAWVRRVILPGMIGERAAFDWHTFAVWAGTVTIAAIITGLAPMLQARGDPLTGLREGAQHGSTRRSSVYRGLLVTQTALSAVLLVGAGLFLHSLHKVTTLDLGLDTDRSFVVSIDFTGSGRDGREAAAFLERALERVRGLPGVEHASLAVDAPLRRAGALGLRVNPAGEWVTMPLGGLPLANRVADGFFDATGMRMKSGRPFAPTDRTGPPVIVVNESLAEAAWPGRSPIGECAYLSSNPETCARVIGVVRNAATFRIREEERHWIYVPLHPASASSRLLLLRTAPGLRGVEGTVGRALLQMDPALPYVDVQRLGDALDPQIRPWRLGASVFSVFGALAAVLAAFGLYTAVAYGVTQRTREIGVRIAVGAATARVALLVLGDGLRVAISGVVLGLGLVLVGGRWVANLLFDTSPREPMILMVVALGLLVVAALASLVPARRATLVSPMNALRAD